jgi:hypothetical protein
MKKFALYFLIATCFSGGIFAKTALDLSKGTVELGGSIQLPIRIPKGGSTLVGLHIAPEFKYFTTRGFSLGLSTTVARDSLTGEGVPWVFSIGASGTYYFDLAAAVYPYLGAAGSMSWQTQKNKDMIFSIAAPVGILVALNSRVALDVGVPITFVFTKDGFSEARLPIGYIGVRAFF